MEGRVWKLARRMLRCQVVSSVSEDWEMDGTTVG